MGTACSRGVNRRRPATLDGSSFEVVARPEWWRSAWWTASTQIRNGCPEPLAARLGRTIRTICTKRRAEVGIGEASEDTYPSHRSGRADFPHPAPQIRDSTRTGRVGVRSAQLEGGSGHGEEPNDAT